MLCWLRFWQSLKLGRTISVHSSLLTSIFLLFRLSNVVPHSFSTFDVSRKLARGNIFFSDTMAIILVKWSKTIQFRNKIARIHIPMLPSSRLCPVTAVKQMLSHIPGSQDDPLFRICRHGRWLPLTDSMVRKHLK